MSAAAELRRVASRLLEAGTVQVVIGYGLGTRGRRRAVFARRPEEAAALVHDEGCLQNLAVYLLKEEVRRLGKPALVASPAALRSMVQLGIERQLADGAVLALVVAEEGSVRLLPDRAGIEQQLAAVPDRLHPAAQADLERLAAMSAPERRAFWAAQLDPCIKCYACRASCPMCYCGRCTVDCNRPQWIPVASHGLGNLEYHLMRAMHLAGRCVECGNCVRACPVGIPVHLLTVFAEESIRRHFGADAGAARPGYALTTYRPEDEEDFIR